MAITVQTLNVGLLYRLDISNTSGTVTLLQWNPATGLFLSSYLDSTALLLLSQRTAILTAGIASADLPNQNAFLLALLKVNDLGGLLPTPQVSTAAGIVSLNLTGLSATTNYYVLLSIPHSSGSPV